MAKIQCSAFNIVAFIFIVIGFICQCVAVGIPYWYYIDGETYGGLWFVCKPFPGCTALWKHRLSDSFRAAQALECIGLALGFLAIALNAMYIGLQPQKRFYLPQMVCTLIPIVAAASIVAGNVVYGLEIEPDLLHAGFFLACIAAGFMVIGAMLSCCGKRPSKY